MIVVDRPENALTMSASLQDQQGGFRIKESAKAFRILSSALYSNPIQAIIRELACNARDSHVEAGNNEPFVVHLPTSMEPTFWVQDYGVGLDHSQVMNLYTTFFESTKTSSNDFVGALGLGSKSPFSYTDNFTIVAIKNGERNVYSAFINDIGVPSIVRGDSRPTTEAPGVKVELAVEAKDFTRFAEEALEVFKWFDQLPKINNSSIKKAALPKWKPIAGSNLDFGVETTVTSSFYGSSSRSSVVMGGVRYLIDENNKGLKKYSELLKRGLVLRFPIGAVEPMPSREGLTYTPETLNAITEVLDTINQKLSEHLETELLAIKNDFDRAVFLVKQTDSLLSQTAYALRTKYKLDTVRIDVSQPTLLAKGVEVRRFVATASGPLVSKGLLEKDEKIVIDPNTRYSRDVTFFWDDCKSRVSDISGSRCGSGIYVFYGKELQSEAFRKALMDEHFYGASILPVSSKFEPEPRVKVVKAECYTFGIETVYKSWRNVDVIKAKKSTVIPSGAEYYIEVANGKLVDSLIHGLDPNLVLHTLGLTKIIGLTKNSKVDKSKLTSVHDAYQKIIDLEIAAYSVEDKFASLVALEYSNQHYGSTQTFTPQVLKKFDDVNLRFRHSSYKNVSRLMEHGRIRDKVVLNGKNPARAADDLKVATAKYSAINFNTDDVTSIIELANYIHSKK